MDPYTLSMMIDGKREVLAHARGIRDWKRLFGK
jgi:hypothetical protein